MPVNQDIRDGIINSLNIAFKDRVSKADTTAIEQELYNLYGNNTKAYITRQKELVAFFKGDSDSVTEKIANGDYTPVQIAKTDFIEFQFPKKSEIDYKGLKDNDLQVSTKAVRDAVLIKLKGLYKNILDIPLNDVPMEPVKDIEQALFEKFGTDPHGYMVALTRILLFANPKSYIGQYAKSFREKLLQGVYDPERLVELDLTDLLPEIFMNPNSSQAKLLELHSSIEKSVMEETADVVADINVTIDPTGKRIKIPVRDHTQLRKQLGNNQVDTHKICGNPYWNMKKVNTIICKQDQKFYCLDIEELLVQLAKGDTAKNYFTNKDLSKEINDNLQKVYKKEIQEISKNGGKKVSVGSRTMSELETLEKTLDHLEYLADLMKDQDVVDAVAVFGLEFFEDNKNIERKDAIESIPVLTREEFDAIISKKPEKGAIEFRDWLNDNITVIKDILAKDEVESDTEVEIVKKDSGAIVVPEYIADRDRESAFVKQEIISDGSMSKFIIDDYLSRLDDANKTARDQMKRIVDVEKRQEKNTEIREINETIKKLKNEAKTINGIIIILDSYLNGLKQKVVDLEDDMTPETREERRELVSSIENVEQEIAYVEKMRDAFVKA